MTGASKILTVSYGTFSCTLEGFDDPFNTMKAIAEYFRDLAAGDRYFGAEPPTPDAAMLHRIAEREIQRRVEAKIQDNGVILRAGDAAELPAAAPATTAYTPAEPARPALHDAEVSAESVAARLQRIRARHIAAAQVEDVVAEVEEATAPEAPPAIVAPAIVPPAAAADDAYSEDQHAEDLAPSPLDAADLIETTVQMPAEIPEAIEELLDAAETVSAVDVLDDIASDMTSDRPEADFAEVDLSVRADDAVIEPADQDSVVAAEDAMLSALSLDTALAEEVLPETTDLASENDAADDLPEAWAGDAAEDEDAMLARLSETAADEAAAPEVEFDDEDLEDEYDDDDDDDDEDEDEDEDEGYDLNLDLAEDFYAADSIEELDQIDDEDPADETDAAEMLETAEDLPAAIETAELPTEAPAEAAPQPAPRARARVIRIRRAEPAVTTAQTAPEATPAPATEAETAAEPAPEPAPASALSDEAEAALQAELAALEAEIGGLSTPEAAPAVSPEAPETPEAPEAAPHQNIKTPTEDDAVNRLMAQAKSEMDGSETRRRQSAIAHLKAAVAATVADRALSGDNADTASARMDAYRSDLDRVVRPRRPVSEGATPRPAATPEAARPSPLVLVSAQRIDRAQPENPAQPEAPRSVMPVRPRRVTTAAPETQPAASPAPIAPVMQNFDHDARNEAYFDEDDILSPGETSNVFDDATSFQDFADQLGATALPDLLEAAAVYCAEILQRPEFSRPLVMRQIAGLPGQGDTAREDYLRGFGALLRQGRIAKVKRGMFALTDRSPYLAEARKQAS